MDIHQLNSLGNIFDKVGQWAVETFDKAEAERREERKQQAIHANNQLANEVKALAIEHGKNKQSSFIAQWEIIWELRKALAKLQKKPEPNMPIELATAYRLQKVQAQTSGEKGLLTLAVGDDAPMALNTIL